MKKYLFFSVVVFFACITMSCSSSSNKVDKETSIETEAYNKGYNDGKNHIYFDSSSKYDGTEYRVDYILKYKEGYNAGEAESE